MQRRALETWLLAFSTLYLALDCLLFGLLEKYYVRQLKVVEMRHGPSDHASQLLQVLSVCKTIFVSKFVISSWPVEMLLFLEMEAFVHYFHPCSFFY